MIAKTDSSSGASAPENIDTASTRTAAAQDDESASLLPAPEYVAADPATMLAKLFVKNAQQKRTGDDVSLGIQEAAEDAADAKRMQAMKDKASSTLAAGIASGLSQCASGAFTGVAGFASAKTAATAKRTPGTDAGAFPSADARARSVGNIWEGAAGLSAGTGKVLEAAWRSEADHYDREIANTESAAKLSKRSQEALHRELDAGSQHEGKVMQLLQEIKQAQVQCERAALLRMA